MIFLDAEDLLRIAARVLGEPPELRDPGLIEAAAVRPQATAFGEDAYPDLVTKAAALMHSLARNHPLVDGNKRLALAGTFVFLGINGATLALTEDEAYDLTIEVATGQLDDVASIATRLRLQSRPATTVPDPGASS